MEQAQATVPGGNRVSGVVQSGGRCIGCARGRAAAYPITGVRLAIQRFARGEPRHQGRTASPGANRSSPDPQYRASIWPNCRLMPRNGCTTLARTDGLSCSATTSPDPCASNRHRRYRTTGPRHGWTCTHLSDSHGFGSGRGRRLGRLEGDGAEVAEASVPTVRVVPRFDSGEDGLDHVGT